MYDLISWYIAKTIFCRIVCFEEVACGLNDISNNRLKFADEPGIRLLYDNNLYK